MNKRESEIGIEAQEKYIQSNLSLISKCQEAKLAIQARTLSET